MLPQTQHLQDYLHIDPRTLMYVHVGTAKGCDGYLQSEERTALSVTVLPSAWHNQLQV